MMVVCWRGGLVAWAVVRVFVAACFRARACHASESEQEADRVEEYAKCVALVHAFQYPRPLLFIITSHR